MIPRDNPAYRRVHEPSPTPPPMLRITGLASLAFFSFFTLSYIFAFFTIEYSSCLELQFGGDLRIPFAQFEK